jgi:hypothetical protein
MILKSTSCAIYLILFISGCATIDPKSSSIASSEDKNSATVQGWGNYYLINFSKCRTNLLGNKVKVAVLTPLRETGVKFEAKQIKVKPNQPVNVAYIDYRGSYECKIGGQFTPDSNTTYTLLGEWVKDKCFLQVKDFSSQNIIPIKEISTSHIECNE